MKEFFEIVKLLRNGFFNFKIFFFTRKREKLKEIISLQFCFKFTFPHFLQFTIFQNFFFRILKLSGVVFFKFFSCYLTGKSSFNFKNLNNIMSPISEFIHVLRLSYFVSKLPFISLTCGIRNLISFFLVFVIC